MATYIDLDRTCTQSCILAYDAASKLTDQSFAKPPEYYEWKRGADYTIGGHFGGSVQVVTNFVTTGSIPVPAPFGIPWEWYINADVTVDNGFGTVVTQTLVLKSGSVPAIVGYVPFVEESQAISGTVSFSYPTRIFYDIDEGVAGTQYVWPPRTKYTQYERSRVGQTATVSITLNGQTVTASGVIASAVGSDYNFTFDAKAFANGASASVENFILSAPQINSILIPSYSYILARDASQFASQDSTINLHTTGADDAFGDPVETYAQLTSDVFLERNINFKGWLNAWSGAMNNEKAVNVYGCEAFPLYSPFTADYDFPYNGYKYGFNAELKLGGSFLNDSLNNDTMPISNIYAELVDPYPLFADPGNSIRMPFRGWHFNGASIYHQKEITLPGSGTSRVYAYPNCENFSAYRFLDVTANSNTASNITSTLDVRYGQLSNTAILQTDITFSPAGNTSRVDLCFADQLHSTYPFPDISYQNNPYPRANPIDTVNQANYKKVNDDLYGISLVGALSLTGNINVSSIKLIRDDNSALCNFIAPNYGDSVDGYTVLPEVYTAGATVPDNVTVFYTGRRFWQHNTQGKEEEEFDVLFINDQSSIVTSGTGISNLCDRIEATNYLGDKIHPGWTANPSTPISNASYLEHGYLNSIDGYSTWLMGGGMEYADGNQRFGFNRDLSQETNDYDVLAQTIFDELNHDFIPDYPDPFKLEAPGETDLKLYSFQSWRGQFHGIVQYQQNGLTVTTKTSPSMVFGPNATTDILGTYFTGANYNKLTSWIVGVGATETSVISDLLGSSTERVSFYYVLVGQYVISAAMSGFYQHMIGTLTGNTVELITTDTTDFSTFENLSTNITNAAEPAISWKSPTNQNELAIVIRNISNNNIEYYTLNDFVTGVASMPTVLGSGKTPAIAINGNGSQLIVFRTSSSNIQRVILDAYGNITTAASNVITGNVEESGLGCYWREDVPYIVYDHTSNGITVVKSDDYGETFS
jgi:hypothetical protein